MNLYPNDHGFDWNWRKPCEAQMASRLRYETHGSSRKPRWTRVPDIYLAAPSKVDIVLSETEILAASWGEPGWKNWNLKEKKSLRSILLMVIRLTTWGWYSLSHFQGFIHLKWCRISPINSIVHRSMQSPRLHLYFQHVKWWYRGWTMICSHY